MLSTFFRGRIDKTDNIEELQQELMILQKHYSMLDSSNRIRFKKKIDYISDRIKLLEKWHNGNELL